MHTETPQLRRSSEIKSNCKKPSARRTETMQRLKHLMPDCRWPFRVFRRTQILPVLLCFVRRVTFTRHFSEYAESKTQPVATDSDGNTPYKAQQSRQDLCPAKNSKWPSAIWHEMF